MNMWEHQHWSTANNALAIYLLFEKQKKQKKALKAIKALKQGVKFVQNQHVNYNNWLSPC